MRFMIMHKLTAKLEQGVMPTPAEIAEIHGMMGEAAKAGILLSGEGLKPSSERLHIAYKGGERVITAGPFADKGELIAGFATMKVKTRDEALAWLDRFAAVTGDVELFLGPAVEPWDLGMAPKPENAPLRLLAMHRMDERAERELPPEPQMMARMGALIQEMTATGVLQTTAALASTKHGARIHFDGDKHSVTDGPFAESKALISGFSIFELPSKAAAIEWGIRWGQTIKVHEVEVRQVAD